MPIHHIHLSTPIQPSFRTEQVAGLFDLSLDDLAGERFAHTLTAELPGLDEDWTIGAIVGPSGSGKTTLARAAYGDALYEPAPWPENVAVIEALDQSSNPKSEIGAPTPVGHLKLKHLLRVLTAVGLASPPSWLKPYRVLSTGERFRADLARALLAAGVQESKFEVQSPHRDSTLNIEPGTLNPGLLVIDEFTSTLDRTVACTASFALAKFLRAASASNLKSEIGAPTPVGHPKFIALSCHTDFLPWLAPDWILDLGGEARSPMGETERRRDRETERGRNTNDCPSLHPSVAPSLHPHWPRGSLHRPALRLAIRRVPQRLWPHFARHHYLSGGLSTAATCYAAFLDGVTEGRRGGETEPTESSLHLSFPPSLCPRPQSLDCGPSLPAAFCAVLATLGWKRTKRVTRLVVLPEFQGLGIGPRLAEAVAAAQAAKGNRVTITASHPSVLAWCSRSPRWRYVGLKKTGSTRQQLGPRAIRCSTGRAVASFEWVGDREGEAVVSNQRAEP
jgi:GNAT superfamily N-acetyltransferase